MALRKRTGGGRKDRGTEWDEVREKDMYTTREEIREKKKWAPQGRGGFPGGTLPRGEPCRRRRQGGKEKAGERAKSMYILYAYFFLFFLCIFTNTKRDGCLIYPLLLASYSCTCSASGYFIPSLPMAFCFISSRSTLLSTSFS